MANNIIITGANQGIGYYMVEKLLSEGNKVSVLDIETDNLTNLKKKYDCLIFYKVDLRNYDEVKRAVDETVAEFDTIDIAVHNACKCTFESESKTDLDTYKDVFDVNYLGALRLVKCVIPYMSAQKKGRVIFTSSGVGVTGFMNISPYSSTKGALEALAKCLRIEYAKDNIMTLNYMCTIMSEFKVDANRILGLEIEKQSSCETIDSKLENLPLKTKKDLIEIFDFMINKARGNLAS